MKVSSQIIFLLFMTGVCLGQQDIEQKIRLNQLGFYPHASKMAAVVEPSGSEFYIIDKKNKKVFTGMLRPPVPSPFSGKLISIADFSELTTPGVYQLVIPSMGASYSFDIKEHVFDPLERGVIKAYYYMRVSTGLDEKHAGHWKRTAGHPDNRIVVHASAVSPSRPAGTIISSPKGWYDAGDYNKYIVNSGITMGTLLSAYEDFPAYYKQLSLQIPESSNAIPDILDEALWNLRWMMTMQDPEDGGVYHKLTNEAFDKMIMPDKATKPRFVVQKSTAATLDFAATLAQAARIFESFKTNLPGFADSCRAASIRAWAWAQQHPQVLYDQKEMNKQFDPDISTGEYGDRNVSDEFVWAAAELFATTGDEKYLDHIKIQPGDKEVASWSNVRLLATYTLCRFEKQWPSSFHNMGDQLKRQLIEKADMLVKGIPGNVYQTVMGTSSSDFIWGSNAVAANQSVLLVNAYLLTKNASYLDAALTNLDYILGRNGTGYSYVTGFGDKTPRHPHQRLSEADGLADPLPGWLVGGPNPGRQDKCNYPSAVADEAYIDDVCSYASNEIAINWNAPLVYITGAIEFLEEKFKLKH
jgi:endoglucanase